MIKPLHAGIDFGTSGCRLVLIDAKKNQIYSQQIRYPDQVIQSSEIWWNALSQLLITCPTEFKKHIQSIAIDGTSGTLLLTDKKGKPSSTALMYNDSRASD